MGMPNVERDDQDTEHHEYLETPLTPRCGWCGQPLLGQRAGAKYCDRAHKNSARRTRKARNEQVATLRDKHPLPVDADASLLELHKRAGGPPKDWRDDPRSFSDYGELPDDFEIAAQIDTESVYEDERDAQFHAMAQVDAAEQTPRRNWFGLKRQYSRNPGVELPEIAQERIDRYADEQAAIKDRLRGGTGQPQDRFNPDITKNVVADKGRASRQQNKVFTTADPRPQSQREAYNFEEAEQLNGSFYRQARGGGQRAQYSDYAWNLEDAFRF